MKEAWMMWRRFVVNDALLAAEVVSTWLN